jgi:hypothetical protein
MRLFAQVMPITDGGNLGGLRLIVNWTVVARLDELALRKQKTKNATVEVAIQGREWTTNETGHESEWRVVSDQH